MRRGALLIDTRPVDQRQRDGTIPGAIVVDRNVLEWRLDPTSPDHMPEITQVDQQVIAICNQGYSSSLVAATLQRIGLRQASDVIGGFEAWAAAGLPVVSWPPNPVTDRDPGAHNNGHHGPPLLRQKQYEEPSVFRVHNLLREGRRQRRLPDSPVPSVCVLDPDGDVVRHLKADGLARRHQGWACYHSELWITDRDAREIGIVPCAVGAPYAVLVAEELHASGCELVVSVTSAGRILPMGEPPYFILIEKAWRDEGTSLHYLQPSEWSHLHPQLSALLIRAFDGLGEPVLTGASWTTDAPFRETATAIAAATRAGVHAVEMEAAALYAYATSRQRAVVCVAHVTNTLATAGDDFEKGDDGGTQRILAVVDAIATAWASQTTPR